MDYTHACLFLPLPVDLERLRLRSFGTGPYFLEISTPVENCHINRRPVSTLTVHIRKASRQSLKYKSFLAFVSQNRMTGII